MTDIIIYHNPECGTSRNALALIRNAGIEPHVIEYLKTPPSRALLVQLTERAGITPRDLLREKHVMRYAAEDDFGLPATAFLICRFWLIDAWWQQGRREEAREAFVDALAHRNRYGLLSEDVDPKTGALFGNFPQTYSMAGLILTGMKLSRNWEDRYWRS